MWKEQLLKRNIMTIHVEIQGNILVEHSQIRSIISVGIIREAHGNPKINTPPARGGNEVGKRSK
jgi:hypothetical protein